MGSLLRRALTRCKKIFSTNRSKEDDGDHNSNDQLSRIPSELMVQILTKVDLVTLCRCKATSQHFVPFLSQIRTYSTSVPSSLFVAPRVKKLRVIKYTCYVTALFSCLIVLYFVVLGLFRLLFSGFFIGLILLGGAYWLFSRYFPFATLAMIRFTNYLVALVLSAVAMVFRLVRYVVFHPLLGAPLRVLYDVSVSLFGCCIIDCLFISWISRSGRSFLRSLTGLAYLEVTLPTLFFDHTILWMRTDIQYVGKKRYVLFVISEIIQHYQDSDDQEEETGEWAYIIKRLRPIVVALLYASTYYQFMLSFRELFDIEKVVMSKNSCTNARIRFYFKESTRKEKESFVHKLKVLVRKILRPKQMHSKTCSLPTTFTINEGSLHLKNAWLLFHCVDEDDDADTADVGSSNVDDLIWDCLCDEEEHCKDDERKDLREAARMILKGQASTP